MKGGGKGEKQGGWTAKNHVGHPCMSPWVEDPDKKECLFAAPLGLELLHQAGISTLQENHR